MLSKNVIYAFFALFALAGLITIVAGIANDNTKALVTGIVVLAATVVLYFVWRWDQGASRRRRAPI